MNKQDAALVAKLLATMRDATLRLEKYYDNGDVENFETTKREVIALQRKIDETI